MRYSVSCVYNKNVVLTFTFPCLSLITNFSPIPNIFHQTAIEQKVFISTAQPYYVKVCSRKCRSPCIYYIHSKYDVRYNRAMYRAGAELPAWGGGLSLEGLMLLVAYLGHRYPIPGCMAGGVCTQCSGHALHHKSPSFTSHAFMNSPPANSPNHQQKPSHQSPAKKIHHQ